MDNHSFILFKKNYLRVENKAKSDVSFHWEMRVAVALKNYSSTYENIFFCSAPFLSSQYIPQMLKLIILYQSRNFSTYEVEVS